MRVCTSSKYAGRERQRAKVDGKREREIATKDFLPTVLDKSTSIRAETCRSALWIFLESE